MRKTGNLQAVVEIGTNSVKLLIASKRSGAKGGSYTEVTHDVVAITRLGEGVAKRGLLDSKAIDRTLAKLLEFRNMADEAGAPIVRAVATEGVRLASDRLVFLDPASKILGVEVEVITGAEEARLSYLSVTEEHMEEREVRVVDIGGASTELAWGQGTDLAGAVSLPIGAVKLHEWAKEKNRPEGFLGYMASRKLLQTNQAVKSLAPLSILYGVGGTCGAVAAMLLRLKDAGHRRADRSRHHIAKICDLRKELAGISPEERTKLLGVEPKRADVIVAGITILLAVMEHCGARILVFRDRGLRYALIKSE